MHKLKHRRMLSVHQAALFYHEGDLTLIEFAQRGCGIFSMNSLKNCLDVFLGNLFQVSIAEQGIGAHGLQKLLPLHSTLFYNSVVKVSLYLIKCI